MVFLLGTLSVPSHEPGILLLKRRMDVGLQPAVSSTLRPGTDPL